MVEKTRVLFGMSRAAAVIVPDGVLVHGGGELVGDIV